MKIGIWSSSSLPNQIENLQTGRESWAGNGLDAIFHQCKWHLFHDEPEGWNEKLRSSWRTNVIVHVFQETDHFECGELFSQSHFREPVVECPAIYTNMSESWNAKNKKQKNMWQRQFASWYERVHAYCYCPISRQMNPQLVVISITYVKETKHGRSTAVVGSATIFLQLNWLCLRARISDWRRFLVEAFSNRVDSTTNFFLQHLEHFLVKRKALAHIIVKLKSNETRRAINMPIAARWIEGGCIHHVIKARAG